MGRKHHHFLSSSAAANALVATPSAPATASFSFSFSSSSPSSSLSSSSSSSAAPSSSGAPSLSDALTEAEILAALKDSDFVFHFGDPNAQATSGAGGRLVNANIATFAALTGTRFSSSMAFMEACSLNGPLMHPRASATMLSINGTLTAAMIPEGITQAIAATVKPSQALYVPQGSIYALLNLGCNPIIAWSSFDDIDPGTTVVAQAMFGLSDSILEAAFGQTSTSVIDAIGKQIPDNIAAATADCFKSCNLTPPKTQPTAQHVSQASSTVTAGGSSGSASSAGGAAGAGAANAEAGPPVRLEESKPSIVDKAKHFFDAPLSPGKIAGIAIVGFILLLIIIFSIFACVRASKRRRARRTGGFASMSTVGPMGSRNIGGPIPLFTAGPRGKYAAAKYDLPHDEMDADAFVPRKYDDPYDDHRNLRAPSPVPASHRDAYRD